MANIMCGAIYSKGEGEVVDITDDEIVTTIGSFSYSIEENGTPIVSVGESLVDITLLTRQVTISRDGELLPDVRKISERMQLYSSSPSRVAYLKAISSAIAKRKYTVLLTVEIFTRLGREGAEMLSSILNTAILSSVESSTTISQEETLNTISTGVMTTVDGTVATLNILDVLKVDLMDNSTIEVIAEEQMVLAENTSLSIIDEYRISMTPLLLDDIIRGIDDSLRIVEQIEVTTFEAKHGLEGEKTDHTVPHVHIDDDLTISDSGEMSAIDDGATYREGLAVLEDTVTAIESRLSTIQAYGIADILLMEKKTFLLNDTDTLISTDKIDITTTRAFFSTGGFDAIGYASKADHEEMLSSDSVTYSVVDGSVVEGQDTNSSVGINRMDYSSMTMEEAKSLLIKIQDLAVGLDQSSVSSNNEIDEL
jgi:hypothetical protein